MKNTIQHLGLLAICIFTLLQHSPTAAPTMNLPTRRSSLFVATPMTTLPAAKMALAARMVTFLPSIWLGIPEMRANTAAAPMVMATMTWCQRSRSDLPSPDSSLVTVGECTHNVMCQYPESSSMMTAMAPEMTPVS